MVHTKKIFLKNLQKKKKKGYCSIDMETWAAKWLSERQST